MSRAGDCYDNALVESFFSTLKAELAGFGAFETRQQAHQSLFDYIERFYNPRRLHSSLGYLRGCETPSRQKSRLQDTSSGRSRLPRQGPRFPGEVPDNA